MLSVPRFHGDLAVTGSPAPLYSLASWRGFCGEISGRPWAGAAAEALSRRPLLLCQRRAAYSSRNAHYAIAERIIANSSDGSQCVRHQGGGGTPRFAFPRPRIAGSFGPFLRPRARGTSRGSCGQVPRPRPIASPFAPSELISHGSVPTGGVGVSVYPLEFRL